METAQAIRSTRDNRGRSKVRGTGNDPSTLVVATVVALTALAARTPGAIRDSFWQDEVASARVIVERTPVGLVRHIARVEATPPLWYSLGWIAHSVGVSPNGFRWTSVIFGAALAGLTVLYARRLLPLWASGVAGLLVALGWQSLMHGRELRAYELFALLAVVLPFALDAAIESDSRSAWLWLAGCVAVGSLTNYFFLLGVAAGAVWLWTTPSLRVRRKRVVTALGAGLIPLLIWSPILIHQYLGKRFTWIGSYSTKQVLDSFWLLFAQHLPSNQIIRQAVPIGFFIVVLIGAFVLWRSSDRGRLCGLLLIVPFALQVLAWLAGARVFDTRNLIGTAPFAGIALSAILVRLPRSACVVGAVAVSCVLILGAVRIESHPPTPYQDIARTLVAEGWNEHDPIMLIGDYFSFAIPLSWYLPAGRAQTLAEPTGTRCPSIFVLAQGPAGRRFVQHSRLVGDRQSDGSVVVGRLRSNLLPTWSGWRQSRVLASVSSPPGCVKLVPEDQIVSRLHGRAV